MGYNIGLRLIDEFLARSTLGRCSTLADTAEVIAKVAFKMFLGITARVPESSIVEKTSFILVIDKNPLATFVELPEEYKELKYSNLLCGVIRGALEMVQMRVECTYEKDSLRGDDADQIKVVLKEIMTDELPPGDE
eukprot:TRINITY_DN2328_c0_g1_i1.p1 TRINITY_DN2328_c0_g1~~TRINITY_DN2328_c0_g1_i1.p1  ORF type:complete len:146 (+),score=17.69 TRINITY_DN2328_c0_g1_i1:32-439(+)